MYNRLIAVFEGYKFINKLGNAWNEIKIDQIIAR